MAIESINPATGKLLRRFDPHPDDLLRQKISLASDAFRGYATVPLEHRALCMRKLASLLEHETEDLATMITEEMGKPIDASRFEILKCAHACRYYAEHAARMREFLNAKTVVIASANSTSETPTQPHPESPYTR